MELSVDNLIAIGVAVFGTGGFLYYQQNNRNKKIGNDNLVIEQMAKLIEELKAERAESKAFFESEMARVVASNATKAEKIEQLEKDKMDLIDENIRLKLENAEKDKQIAVQKERECIKAECLQREQEGSL